MFPLPAVGAFSSDVNLGERELKSLAWPICSTTRQISQIQPNQSLPRTNTSPRLPALHPCILPHTRVRINLPRVGCKSIRSTVRSRPAYSRSRLLLLKYRGPVPTVSHRLLPLAWIDLRYRSANYQDRVIWIQSIGSIYASG